MGFFKQEYWSGLPFPSPKILPDPGIEPVSLVLVGGLFSAEPPGKPQDFKHDLIYMSHQSYEKATVIFHIL